MWPIIQSQKSIKVGIAKKEKRILFNLNWTYANCAVLVLRMAQRKWKDTKQQPCTAGPGNMIGAVA